MRIVITGQAGFIGTHLYNFLGLDKEFQRIPFKDSFFEDESELRNFVRNCDVIVHMAAINRHPDMQILHDENINLTRKLISALKAENVSPHLLVSSSTQEEKDNLYGKAKRECREMLALWAKENGAIFTGLVIPNVFGPFGRPNYNSAIATFCYKLTHNETPEIIVDGSIKLVYVNDLCKEIIKVIKSRINKDLYLVSHNAELKVSEVLTLLNYYKSSYFDKQIIPKINNYFEQCLFNT
ncbi:MAG: NAD-dependent epimerase/dehydratase family protein, partial [Lentisphaerota bacterium]